MFLEKMLEYVLEIYNKDELDSLDYVTIETKLKEAYSESSKEFKGGFTKFVMNELVGEEK